MKKWLLDKNQIMFQIPVRKKSLYQEFWRLHILLQGTKKTKYDESIKDRYYKMQYLLFYNFKYHELYNILQSSFSKWEKRINAK